MANGNRIRVGLVGVGSWARYGHIPALRLLPEYEIVAVSSRQMSKATELAAVFGIPRAFDKVQELIDHPDVDLVVVLPPAPQHAAVVKSAILAGKDVYCEWPLTTSTADSKELLELAERCGVRHTVGLQRTVGASSLHLRQLLEEGFIGTLRSVRMHVSMSGFGPVRATSLDWTIPSSNFSNILSIYGGHFMDMLFHAIGPPVELSALVRTQFPKLTLTNGQSFQNETPDNVMVTGILQNGAPFQVQIEGGKRNPTGLQIEMTGTEGDLQVSNERSFVTQHKDLIRGAQGESGSWRELQTPERFYTIPPSDLDVSVQDLAQLYRAFAKDRSSDSRTARNFSDALAMHRVIDAICESSSSRHTISL